MTALVPSSPRSSGVRATSSRCDGESGTPSAIPPGRTPNVRLPTVPSGNIWKTAPNLSSSDCVTRIVHPAAGSDSVAGGST